MGGIFAYMCVLLEVEGLVSPGTGLRKSCQCPGGGRPVFKTLATLLRTRF